LRETIIFHDKEFFVGTSGWAYFWNLGNSLEWYMNNTPFNAVELNASFYRFPFPNQVKSWTRRGNKLRWSIKVNQLITHRFRLSSRAIDTFTKFRRLFSPMENAGIIDFYLFQLPPSFRPTARNISRVKDFVERISIGEKFAIEFRNIEWFDLKWVSWIEKLGGVFVSVDAPDFPNKIYPCNGMVYLRLHGRSAWYSHVYTEEEVRGILDIIINQEEVRKVYIFLNNDHGMLPTGELIISMLRKMENSQ